MVDTDQASRPSVLRHNDSGPETVKAYLIGGGIGSLAAAAFMIRDGGVPGANISILAALPVLGGSLDGAVLRGLAPTRLNYGRSTATSPCRVMLSLDD